MKNNFPKTQLIFSALLFVVLSVVFVFLYKKINNNNQVAQEGMTKWGEEAARRNETTSLNSSLQKIAPDLGMLETHFAKSSDVVPFLDTLEKLAPKVGVTTEISSVDALPGNAGLSVGMKASGSFESVYKFLTLLENSPYELDFLSMDMQKVDKKWEVTFKINLLSFVP
ncbi:hypothetical protein HY311_00635 [Candidatus Nomurabacteria bacterium]|nr:hypothetical protein [Candidatus Nomurabacteria bacterium]